MISPKYWIGDVVTFSLRPFAKVDEETGEVIEPAMPEYPARVLSIAHNMRDIPLGPGGTITADGVDIYGLTDRSGQWGFFYQVEIDQAMAEALGLPPYTAHGHPIKYEVVHERNILGVEVDF